MLQTTGLQDFFGGPLIDFGGYFFCWSFHWLADVHFTPSFHVGSTYAPQRNLLLTLQFLGGCPVFRSPMPEIGFPQASEAVVWLPVRWHDGWTTWAVEIWWRKKNEVNSGVSYSTSQRVSHSFCSLHSDTQIKENFSMKELYTLR